MIVRSAASTLNPCRDSERRGVSTCAAARNVRFRGGRAAEDLSASRARHGRSRHTAESQARPCVGRPRYPLRGRGR